MPPPGRAVCGHGFSLAALNKPREGVLNIAIVALAAGAAVAVEGVDCVDASVAEVNNGQLDVIG